MHLCVKQEKWSNYDELKHYFLNESSTVEQVKNLHVAINHEGTEMSIQLCKDDISRTEKQISNLEKAESKTEDQKEKEREALNAKLDDLKEALEKLKTDAAETLPVYTQVVTEMSVKNENISATTRT